MKRYSFFGKILIIFLLVLGFHFLPGKVFACDCGTCYIFGLPGCCTCSAPPVRPITCNGCSGTQCCTNTGGCGPCGTGGTDKPRIFIPYQENSPTDDYSDHYPFIPNYSYVYDDILNKYVFIQTEDHVPGQYGWYFNPGGNISIGFFGESQHWDTDNKKYYCDSDDAEANRMVFDINSRGTRAIPQGSDSGMIMECYQYGHIISVPSYLTAQGYRGAGFYTVSPAADNLTMTLTREAVGRVCTNQSQRIFQRWKSQAYSILKRDNNIPFSNETIWPGSDCNNSSCTQKYYFNFTAAYSYNAHIAFNPYYCQYGDCVNQFEMRLRDITANGPWAVVGSYTTFVQGHQYDLSIKIQTGDNEENALINFTIQAYKCPTETIDITNRTLIAPADADPVKYNLSNLDSHLPENTTPNNPTIYFPVSTNYSRATGTPSANYLGYATFNFTWRFQPNFTSTDDIALRFFKIIYQNEPVLQFRFPLATGGWSGWFNVNKFVVRGDNQNSGGSPTSLVYKFKVNSSYQYQITISDRYTASNSDFGFFVPWVGWNVNNYNPSDFSSMLNTYVHFLGIENEQGYGFFPIIKTSVPGQISGNVRQTTEAGLCTTPPGTFSALPGDWDVTCQGVSAGKPTTSTYLCSNLYQGNVYPVGGTPLTAPLNGWELACVCTVGPVTTTCTSNNPENVTLDTAAKTVDFYWRQKTGPISGNIYLDDDAGGKTCGISSFATNTPPATTTVRCMAAGETMSMAAASAIAGTRYSCVNHVLGNLKFPLGYSYQFGADGFDNTKFFVAKICPASSIVLNSMTEPPDNGPTIYLASILPAWFQVIGGDVAAAGLYSTSGDISVEIPATATIPNFLLSLAGANTADHGIAQAKGSVNLTGIPSNNIADDSKAWYANAVGDWGAKVYDYTFWVDHLSGATSQPVIVDLPSLSGVYKDTPGTLTIADIATGLTWQGISDKKIVILHQGDVDIRGDITINPNSGSSLVIIASGNITVQANVTKLHGYYLADGTITTMHGTETETLAVEGGLIGGLAAGGGISLERNFMSGLNASTPTETFTFRPDIFANLSDELKIKDLVRWKEVAP